jgi:hypothetical protein
LLNHGPAGHSLVQGQLDGKRGMLCCVRCSGLGVLILWQLRRLDTASFPPASRVGFSELLGGLQYARLRSQDRIVDALRIRNGFKTKRRGN